MTFRKNSGKKRLIRPPNEASIMLLLLVRGNLTEDKEIGELYRSAEDFRIYHKYYG